ncbi:MAG: glycosyltransferase [Paludibacteraceae bacterium]|nr:glycosyltransferase [Paludibacteraceae bacterium]
MINKPLFSVLIANYNNGKYLKDAVESVRNQTYANWEIILVDDGSTDNSHELYKELEKDERIHIFLNDQNRGCGYTKNRCVSLANGEWCAFLDPDDMIREDALAIMVDAIDANPQYGAIHSHMYVCDENMNVVYDNTYAYGSEEWNQFIHFQKGIPLFLFRKGVYLSTPGIHLSLAQSVDIDLYYKLSEVTSIYYIDKPLYYYRNNPLSLTKNPSRATATHLWVMLESLKRRGCSDIEVQRELENFWQWRTEPLYEELRRLKNDKFFNLGQRIRSWKRKLLCRK